MELILIDDSKLKIMMSADDMKLYDITCDTIDRDDGLSRQAFMDILSEAREKTGFDAEGARIYVQVYQSKAGGCEMFVTKLPYDTGSDAVVADSAAARKQTKKCIYRFDALSDLMKTCREMKNCGIGRSSTAYADGGNGRYYLITDTEIPLIGEFFGRQCRINSIWYINEHCRKLCDDAVVTLGELQ